MVDSDADDEVLFSVAHSKQQARGLLGNGVKNIDDVMNGPKEDRRLKKTLALCAAFLGLGLAIAVLGPTLPALQRHIGVTTDRMFFAFVGRSVGYLCGSIIGGAMFDWFQPSLLMAVLLLGAGVGLVAAPFTGHLWSLATVLSVVGLAMGGLDTGANVVCLRLWGKRSSPFLQALHFCFAVGAFVSPLLAKPFLPNMLYNPTTNLSMSSAMTPLENSIITTTQMVTNFNSSISVPEPLNATDESVMYTYATTIMTMTETSVNENETSTTNATTMNATTTNATTTNATTTNANETNANETNANDTNANLKETVPALTKEPVATAKEPATVANKAATNKTNGTDSESPDERFQNVYIIVGLCNMLVSVSFFYFFCTSPIKPPPTQGNSNNDGNSKNKDFKNYVLVLMFLFYFLYVGAEIGFGGYIATFATTCSLKYDESTASLLNAAFWGAFATGRGLSICLAGVLLPHVMLVLDMIGCILSSLVLSVYADSSDGVLWIGTMVLGLSMASLFPAGISWLESYYKVTGYMASVLIIGSAFGEMVFPMIISQMFPENDSIQEGFLESLDFGPKGLMYVMLASSGFTAIIFAIMQYLAKQNGVEPLLPTQAPNPAKDITVGVQEAFSLEDLSFKGKPKQTSAINAPKILRLKKHKE